MSREKDEVIRLASEENVIAKPQDIVKQPTVLEFPGLDEKAKYVESDAFTLIPDKPEILKAPPTRLAHIRIINEDNGSGWTWNVPEKDNSAYGNSRR